MFRNSTNETRKGFSFGAVVLLVCLCTPTGALKAEVFFTPEAAKEALWGDTPMTPTPITLTKAQQKSIQKASKVRVNSREVNAWKSADGGWFWIDQVVGKHEFIDMAVAINPDGTIKGLKVMTYRESYGDEVKHPKWLAQFIGRDNAGHLKVDREIDNISGATLSCVHITDGVNRWTETWAQVLRHE